ISFLLFSRKVVHIYLQHRFCAYFVKNGNGFLPTNMLLLMKSAYRKSKTGRKPTRSVRSFVDSLTTDTPTRKEGI
ncbi:MAG: hypothetical protein ACI39E_05570, partial [Acutalibacteraceae bacterium]